MKNKLLIKIILGVSVIALLSQMFFLFVSSSPNNNDTTKVITNTTISSKPASSYTDTLRITFPTALIYNADSLQTDKIKSINKKMVFESMVHECFYQIKNARTVLKKYWPQLKIIETSKAKHLLFIKADKSKICIDLDTKKGMCSLFLFDGKKDPVLTDMTNIDTALRFYFEG